MTDSSDHPAQRMDSSAALVVEIAKRDREIAYVQRLIAQSMVPAEDYQRYLSFLLRAQKTAERLLSKYSTPSPTTDPVSNEGETKGES